MLKNGFLGMVEAGSRLVRQAAGRLWLAVGIACLCSFFLVLAQSREVEVLSLYPDGFSPERIEKPKGLFLLVVNDRSGLDEITLILDSATGQRLGRVSRSLHELTWADELDLPPGRYFLSEENHSNWTCEIVIKGR